MKNSQEREPIPTDKSLRPLLEKALQKERDTQNSQCLVGLSDLFPPGIDLPLKKEINKSQFKFTRDEKKILEEALLVKVLQQTQEGLTQFLELYRKEMKAKGIRVNYDPIPKEVEETIRTGHISLEDLIEHFGIYRMINEHYGFLWKYSKEDHLFLDFRSIPRWVYGQTITTFDFEHPEWNVYTDMTVRNVYTDMAVRRKSIIELINYFREIVKHQDPIVKPEPVRYIPAPKKLVDSHVTEEPAYNWAGNIRGYYKILVKVYDDGSSSMERIGYRDRDNSSV